MCFGEKILPQFFPLGGGLVVERYSDSSVRNSEAGVSASLQCITAKVSCDPLKRMKTRGFLLVKLNF